MSYAHAREHLAFGMDFTEKIRAGSPNSVSSLCGVMCLITIQTAANVISHVDARIHSSHHFLRCTRTRLRGARLPMSDEAVGAGAGAGTACTSDGSSATGVPSLAVEEAHHCVRGRGVRVRRGQGALQWNKDVTEEAAPTSALPRPSSPSPVSARRVARRGAKPRANQNQQSSITAGGRTLVPRV